MASGHVNRTNRPNTWLHRPAKRREDFPCQLGAVHTWHKANITRLSSKVRFRWNSGHCGMSALPQKRTLISPIRQPRLIRRAWSPVSNVVPSR